MKKGRKQKRFVNVTNSLVIYSRESMGVCGENGEKRAFDYFFCHMPTVNTCSPALSQALLKTAKDQPRKWAIKATAYCKDYAKSTELIISDPVKLEELNEITEQARQETIDECNPADLLDIEWIAMPWTKEPPDDAKWSNIIKRVNNHEKFRARSVA